LSLSASRAETAAHVVTTVREAHAVMTAEATAAHAATTEVQEAHVVSALQTLQSSRITNQRCSKTFWK
jgi:hypothetical protein